MPAVHTSPSILGAESYRLIQRFSLNVALDVNAAGTTQAQLVSLAIAPLPIPTQKQALRIVSGGAIVSDNNQLHFLTANGTAVILSGDASLQIRRVWPGFFGPVLLGATGVCIPFNDPEFIFGSDYAEVGGITQLQLNVLADISNSDAAAHPVHSRIAAIVELYENDGMSGHLRDTSAVLREANRLAKDGVRIR
jgi:hypothetical protein